MDSTLKVCPDPEPRKTEQTPVLSAFGESVALLNDIVGTLRDAEQRRMFWRLLHDHAARRLEVL